MMMENSRSPSATTMMGATSSYGNNPGAASFAASIMKTSAVNQFFGGPDETMEWENEEEEIFVNCVKKYTSGSLEDPDQAEGELEELDIPHAKMYEREDVKAWLTVTHAAPEVILAYSPKIRQSDVTDDDDDEQDDDDKEEETTIDNKEGDHEENEETTKDPSSRTNRNNNNNNFVNNITPAGDIWSVAMIALELYTARPIVYGENPRDVFFRAASQICGCPSHANDPEFHRWVMHATKSSLPTKGIRPVPLRSVIPMASSSAVDLLSRMLTLDPSKRLSAREALEHPFFTSDVDDEEEEESDGDY